MHKKLLVCVCAITAMAAIGCNDSKDWKKSAAECGNGIREIGEACDTTTNLTCKDYNPNKQWTEDGIPGCSDTCDLTIGTCVEVNYQPTAACNNGRLDNGEDCDGNLIRDPEASCAKYLGAGATGSLSCVNCKLSTTNCVAASSCGNGTIDEGELCDTNDFGDKTCDSFVEGSTGTLSCINCTTIDSSNCLCGNGVIDGEEECDSTNLNNKTCNDYKEGATGTLSCGSDCKLIYTECRDPETPESCGNGEINEGEDCDFTNLNNKSCSDVVEHSEGTLSCDANCHFVTTQCQVQPYCGDGVINGTEECDGSDLGTATCESEMGSEYTGTLSCNSDCELVTSSCTLGQTEPECGDGVKNGTEDCDNNDLGGATCESELGPEYTGSLTCDSTCNFVISACSLKATCGDHVKNQDSEECDDQDFGTETCETKMGTGFTGNLSCSSECKIVTTACVEPIPDTCNNNVLDTGEECDPTAISYDPIACTPYGTGGSDLSDKFNVGSIACTNACKLADNCELKNATDFTVEKFDELLITALGNKPSYVAQHSLRGMTWNLEDVTFDTSKYYMKLGPWYPDGEDGAPNTEKYIQVDLKQLVKLGPDGKALTENNSFVQVGDAIINDYDYISVNFAYQKVNQNAPKNFAIQLFDGDDFKSVLHNFSTETPGFVGQVTFSVKGMTNPRIRISNYDQNGRGYIYMYNFNVRGLKLK